MARVENSLSHARKPSSSEISRMKGRQFEQFAIEVLHRGAVAVLPQHLPDQWLNALLEEAEILYEGNGHENELPRSKLRGIKPPFAYTRVPPVWRGDTRVACEP